MIVALMLMASRYRGERQNVHAPARLLHDRARQPHARIAIAGPARRLCRTKPLYPRGERGQIAFPLPSERDFFAFEVKQIAAVGRLQFFDNVEKLQRGPFGIEEPSGLNIPLKWTGKSSVNCAGMKRNDDGS